MGRGNAAQSELVVWSNGARIGFFASFQAMTTNDSSFQVSTDQSQLDIPMIYRFLSEQSSWAIGISQPIVERAIENSLCFGGYLDGRQVAFARVITDFATFANLVDVFVVPEYRARATASSWWRPCCATPACSACAVSPSPRVTPTACTNASVSAPPANQKR